MEYQFIKLETIDQWIGQITIQRPEKLNALNDQTMQELEDALERIERQDQYRALIITGSGKRAFAAGADIKELAELSPVALVERARRDQRILCKLERMEKVSVAAINGYALGGGLELALACTLRVAVPEARLGLPEARIGVLPGNGGTQRLPRLIGTGRALELMLTGRLIDAMEAWRIGLVNRVVPREQLISASCELLMEVLEGAPVSIRLIKQLALDALGTPLELGLENEVNALGVTAVTEDRLEGTRAFLEKRKPQFRGC